MLSLFVHKTNRYIMPLTRSQSMKLKQLEQFSFGSNQINNRKRKRISNQNDTDQSPKLYISIHIY